MTQGKSLAVWSMRVLGLSIVLLGLTGCLSGDDGDTGPAGPPGPAGPSGVAATELNFTISSVTVASPPVVNFTVTNQDGSPFSGLADSDLRFNIAKLIPPASGNPSQWQDYIVRVSSGAMQGTQERFRGRDDDIWGTLDNHGDGSYSYTFETDITNVACPAPCTDADGKALDISYQPGLTHRVSIQQGNSALPLANVVYDFVPAGGPVTSMREIVKTDSCNECHSKITAHGTRFEMKLCVTCHNPGSWVDSDTTVDFKVMVHKIHRGEDLPSVVAGGSYAIGTHDFSDVVFPQDIRNCTKCHDSADSDTPQGGNWSTQLSMQACGSCHDDIDFSKDGTVDPAGHPGGIVTDNSECITCHAENRIAGSVEESHAIPAKLAAARFQYNLIDVSGGATPVIQFSVTDPTNGDAPYNITTDPAFTQVATGVSRLAILVGWNALDALDFASSGSGANPAQPISIFPTAQCGGPASGGTPVSADWSCSGPVSGVYTLTKLSALPADAAGTGRVGIEGHPAADDGTGALILRVPVTSVVKDWAITGTLTARRDVVDIAKCDQCHDQLSLHGANRNDQPQLCVMCHNPNATDINRRPKTAIADALNPQPGEGLPSGGVDGKLEESIDFKRLIHGIHGAEMRDNGLVVYGFGGSVNDFGDVRFPGILQDCETCHQSGTYELDGTWETPTLNGILASTTNSAPNATVGGIATGPGSLADGLADQSDDLNMSPTAAVCSSCHDSALAQAHMVVPGGAVFDVTQQYITDMVDGNFETCGVCHGPGRDADVEAVHAER